MVRKCNHRICGRNPVPRAPARTFNQKDAAHFGAKIWSSVLSSKRRYTRARYAKREIFAIYVKYAKTRISEAGQRRCCLAISSSSSVLLLSCSPCFFFLPSFLPSLLPSFLPSFLFLFLFLLQLLFLFLFQLLFLFLFQLLLLLLLFLLLFTNRASSFQAFFPF